MKDLDASIKAFMAAQGGLLTAADIQQLGYSSWDTAGACCMCTLAPDYWSGRVAECI